MEGDDGETAAGLQMVDRGLHALADSAELIVDGDADGLEAALGRMLLFPEGAGRHGRADDIDELERRFDGTVGPHALDGGGDLRGVALLAVFVEDGFEFFARPVVDDLIGGQRLLAVHAHVERRVGHVGKAALRVVELRRRNAQIEQHPVDPVEAKRGEDRADVFKIIVYQRHFFSRAGTAASLRPPARPDHGRRR